MNVTTLVEAVWLGLAVAAIGLEVLGRVRPGVPTSGDALGALVHRPGGRVLALVAWTWLGWHFFVRTHT